MVKQGRRANDWVFRPLMFAIKQANGILDIWKDDRSHRWSTRRILLWIWTWLGANAIWMETHAKVYLIGGTVITPHPLNNAWIQAWAACEGSFIVAVFGPVMIDYWKNMAPAVTAMGAAVRDKIVEPIVLARRDKAAEVGSPGSEYNQ